MRKQKSPSEFGFNRYDTNRLNKAIDRVSDKRTFIRLKAVLLVAQGYSINVVAKIIDKSFQSIYQWIAVYLKHHQAQDLQDAPRTGRPLAAKAISDKRIIDLLRLSPLHMGYQTTIWTVALLAKHLNSSYACSISPRTLYRRMKQIGLECKRPRYVYSEKDPNRTQKKGRLSEN